jgi:hypothetical protein
MANPQRMVVRSMISAVSPEAETARHDELNAQPKSLKRVVKLAAHALATRAPKASGTLVGLRGLDTEPWDAEFIGSGAEFSVFRDSDDEVVKIAHYTVTLSPNEQQAYADKRQAEYQHMANWLGEFVLPQEFSVAPLPFMPGRTAVQVRQPFRGVIDPHIFEPLSPDVIEPNVASLQNEHPGSIQQLSDFVERSRALHGAKDLLPDTNGPANLVMDGDNLCMIDGQPIGTEHFPIQQIILQQLSSLEMAIAA